MIFFRPFQFSIDLGIVIHDPDLSYGYPSMCFIDRTAIQLFP